MEIRFANASGRYALLGAIVFAAGALGYFGIRNARAAHFAALESREGLERAVALEPGDARYWQLLGRYWQYNFDHPDVARTISCYQRALRINPRSDSLWMDLGSAYELEGAAAGARRAFEQAKEAHPISAEVAWRYGNFLLRQEQYDDAFEEIRQAVQADPGRAAAAISRCWRSNPRIDAILSRALPPRRDVYLEALRFLVSEQADDAALAVWKRLVELRPAMEMKQSFPLVDGLVQRNRVADARTVWEQALHLAGLEPPATTAGSPVWDGGFEADFLNGGFGWRQKDTPGARFDFDTETKYSGARSLRIRFDGSENLAFINVHQWVPVEPNTRYRFSAWMRTQNITTDSGVRFAVFDPRNPAATGRLTPDLTGTQPWTRLELDIAAGPETRLLEIDVRRAPSLKLDNKLQGTVWVDEVTLVPAAPVPPRRSTP